jgi:hypothetical protein
MKILPLEFRRQRTNTSCAPAHTIRAVIIIIIIIIKRREGFEATWPHLLTAGEQVEAVGRKLKRRDRGGVPVVSVDAGLLVGLDLGLGVAVHRIDAGEAVVYSNHARLISVRHARLGRMEVERSDLVGVVDAVERWRT